MEKENNHKTKITVASCILKKSFNSTAWILGTLLQMGELTVDVFLSPNLYADFPSSFYSKAPDSKTSFFSKKNKLMPKTTAIKQSIWRLQKMGLVEKKGNKLSLTSAGKKVIQYAFSRSRSVSSKWDGKYRIVIFDIPISGNKIRNWLRQELMLLNYKKLQESVFIGKYPLPKDLIADIKLNKVGRYINYILADKVYKNIF